MLLRTPTSHNFAAAFHAVPETEIVGVFDFGERERSEFVACWQDVWSDLPAYGDFDRMLNELHPDLLCLATRQTLHADQIELAIAAGVRGILCDKPLVTTLAEMDRVVAACENAPLAFALDRRWAVSYRHLRQLIGEGLVGRVSSLVAYGLPNTINHGCHWYDAILALLGDLEPVWVSGELDPGDPSDERRQIDPPCRAQIGTEDDIVAFVTCDGPGPGFEIAGEDGRLSVYADAAQAAVWREGSVKSLPLPTPVGDWPAGVGMVEDLVHAVGEGSRTACDIAEARRATEIGFAIHSSSARQGARVSLPAADRQLRVKSLPWGNEPPGS